MPIILVSNEFRGVSMIVCLCWRHSQSWDSQFALFLFKRGSTTDQLETNQDIQSHTLKFICLKYRNGKDQLQQGLEWSISQGSLLFYLEVTFARNVTQRDRVWRLMGTPVHEGEPVLPQRSS